MKDIIEWLLQMEHLAGSLYMRAATKFSKDLEYSKFLFSLAEDENMHLQAVRNIDKQIKDKKVAPISEIVLDKAIKDENEAPLRDLYERLVSHEISRQTAIKIIARSEFSEWNSILTYVLNNFKKDGREIDKFIETIRAHKKHIESFLRDHSDELDISDVIKKISSIGAGGEKILVAESKKPLRLFISQLLEDFGHVETARDGQEALEKVKNHFYDVIVTNTDMPGKSGIQFFKDAIMSNPDIRKNFIFLYRNSREETEVLFQKYGLSQVKIPFTIRQLQNTVKKHLAVVH